MHTIFRFITLSCIFLCSQIAYAVEGSPVPSSSAFSSYVGIWQDQNQPTHYYTINYHENSDSGSLVLVDLFGVAKTGDTLASSYQGNVTSALGNTLSGSLVSLGNANNVLTFTLKTDFTGTLSPYCDAKTACTQPAIVLKKIF